MNTPAHAVLNLVLLGRKEEPGWVTPIVVGAILPDLPMIAFYAYEKLRGMPERWIWQTGYYGPGWQALFDGAHAFPLIVTALVVAVRAGLPRMAVALASMALHAVGDFLVHHDDAHRHLFPLSDWRFASPVSYWDPRYFGRIVAPLEGVAVLVGCAVLVRRFESSRSRHVVAALGLVYVVYLGFTVWMWVGPVLQRG